MEYIVILFLYFFFFFCAYNQTGYSPHLAISLVQEYKITVKVANHLASTYGGRAADVLGIDMSPFRTQVDSPDGHLHNPEYDSLVSSRGPKLLHADFPYLEAEVRVKTYGNMLWKYVNFFRWVRLYLQ